MIPNTTYRSLLLLTLMVWLVTPSRATEPVKGSHGQVLFRIERSKDSDEVWYVVNMDQHGMPDQDMPVKVFWYKKESGNRIEPLTGIQQKFSYGIHSVYPDKAVTDTWKFRLAAYKNRIFVLKKSDGNQYRVYTDFNGMEMEVRKLYVKFDGGSFLAPTISYVSLSGIDPLTDEEVTEIISGQSTS